MENQGKHVDVWALNNIEYGNKRTLSYDSVCLLCL
jgi:hypothetical protein